MESERFSFQTPHDDAREAGFEPRRGAALNAADEPIDDWAPRVRASLRDARSALAALKESLD